MPQINTEFISVCALYLLPSQVRAICCCVRLVSFTVLVHSICWLILNSVGLILFQIIKSRFVSKTVPPSPPPPKQQQKTHKKQQQQWMYKLDLLTAIGSDQIYVKKKKNQASQLAQPDTYEPAASLQCHPLRSVHTPLMQEEKLLQSPCVLKKSFTKSHYVPFFLQTHWADHIL